MAALLNIPDLLENVKIPHIGLACNVWMMRTKQGAFFNQFLKEEFIAIGWNAITLKNLTQMSFDNLKKIIEIKYPSETQYGSPVNKCNRFATELKENDLVMIVGDREVAFASVGEYYEDANDHYTVRRELEVNSQVEEGMHKQIDIDCPYRKRRKITVIRKVTYDALDPNLYAGMISNRHSLSNLEEYKGFVFAATYDSYYYQDKLHMVFHIEKLGRIRSVDLSGFIYYATQLLTYKEERFIEARASINSPGDILLVMDTAIQYINENSAAFIALALVIFGGNITSNSTNIPMPSLLNAVKALLSYSHNKKMQNLQVEEQEAKVKGMALDNELKQVELYRKKAELDADGQEYLSKIVRKIQSAAASMQVKQVDEKLISFPKHIPSPDDD